METGTTTGLCHSIFELVREFPLGFAVPDLVTIPAYMPATAVTFDVSTSLCQESPFDRTRSAHDPQ